MTNNDAAIDAMNKTRWSETTADPIGDLSKLFDRLEPKRLTRNKQPWYRRFERKRRR